ncbi:adenomatous polyposis coli protein-like [Asterias rubens]|uniref:adenomatous polyposis coli protein-like n=1 Tax=Asterias rubens TaxID=7604 RepID=UPI001455CCCE|nr:adenomatous polyposis coli protein-like [Asterias rubens]
MARRQLEYEARQLREVMQQRLGASDDIGARHEARMQRLCLIEREMQRLQQRRERQEAQENSGNADNHNSVKHEPNANTAGNSNSPKHSTHNTPETKPKEPKNTYINPPNGVNLSALSGLKTEESDSPYAHLSADGTVQQIVGAEAQQQQQGYSGPAIPPTMLHGTWPYVGGAMAIHQRHIVKSSANATSSSSEQETSSVMSFSSSACSSGQGRRLQPGQLGAKVEMVYSLLSMLGTHDKDDMSRTLLAMSSSQDSCIAMRQSGCLPLLIQLLHGPDKDSLLGDTRGSKEARARAAASLHNIVHSHPEERCRKQEARVLRLLEQIRAYCDSLRETEAEDGSKDCAIDTNPGPAMAALMKLSFDEEHRSAICQLGGLHAIADLLQVDYESNGNTTDQYAITVRRYAGMALTNLTFGDAANKALLCSMKGCMRSLVAQLASENEDLRQVAASVLRNLSWRADLASKKILREVSTVGGLMKCALEVKKESTLKSVLSALWNLSAHFTENKADICAVEGALEFLVATLTYKSPSRTWAVVENGGGILRNISSHIATNEVYRQVLRDHNCLQVLLRHLKSSSLTIVSNACGTLWNLSARNKYDQDLLWELGAVSMLKNLVHSKHKMIAMGSSAALRNLMSARPDLLNTSENHKEGPPTLHVRKQRALEAEIDKNLRETYSSMEKDRHALQRRIPVRNQHRSPQNSADYSPVPQRIAIWNPQQSPTHELILNQHRERSHSPTPRQANSREGGGSSQPAHPRDQDVRKLSSSGRNGSDVEPNRTDEGSQNSSGTGSLDSNHKRQTGSSRIAQVMQEVAMHAGIDAPGGQQPQSTQYTDQQSQESSDREAPLLAGHQQGQQPSAHPNSYNFGFREYDSNAPRRASNESINSINSDIYPMGAHAKQPYPKQQMDHSHSMDGTLNALDQHQRHKAMYHHMSHGDTGANMDSTINYSLKYSDESLTPAPRAGSQREENYQPKQLDCGHYNKQSNSEEKNLSNHENQPQPVVLCQECNTPHMQREGMAVGHAFVPPPQADRSYPSNYSEPPTIQRKMMPINDPCGRDIGSDMNDETPVDYSRHNLPGHLRSRFNEDDHEHYSSDQPTDFSQRYNTDLPEATAEGINFVQTSLTTNTTGNIFISNSDKSDISVGNPTDNNSSKDNNSQDQTDLLRSDSVETSASISSTQTAISRAHDDKTQMYCVEDTPVVFSRCSSLSSLDSNEVDRLLDCQEEDLSQSQQDFENQSKDKVQEEHDGAPSMDDSLQILPSEILPSEMPPSDTIESGLQTPASLNQVQDTPLIFSRCSSVSSLSSFEVQSICDDHSSCYSDSRRTSEVVSPSDLPDSPSQTMPPSPRRNRKQAPIQVSSCDPETVGMLPECEENLLTYATEGTPADFSCATSLSGLTIDDDEKAVATRQIDDDENNRGSSDTNNPREVRRDHEVECEEISEREQSMLDECINSAMPPKKSTLSLKPSKIRSRNVVPVRSIKAPQQNGKHVSFSQQVCSQEAPNSYATEDTPINFSTATSLSDLSIEDIDIQTTGEGRLLVNNPLSSSETSPDTTTKQVGKAEEMKSESSSVINDAEDSMLEECINSAMPKARLNKPRSSQLPKHRGAKGLSKMRSPKPSGLPRKRLPSAGVRHKSPSPIPEMGPEYQTASSSQERVQQWQNGLGGTSDSMRAFCTEGTPQQFSTATSLSGLSMDSHNQEDVLNGNVTAQVEEHEQANMKEQKEIVKASQIDSPKQYAVEGTPMSFSRNDSLSSLSCDDDADLFKAKKDLKENTDSKERVRQRQDERGTPAARPQSSPARSLSKLPQPSSKIAQLRKRPDNKSGINVNKFSNAEQPSPRGQLSGQRVSNSSSPYDSPHVFNMEGTPMSFSRNDSLSSLSCEEDADLQTDQTNIKSRFMSSNQVDQAQETALNDQAARSRFGRPAPRKGKSKQSDDQDIDSGRSQSADTPVKFSVEDTPVCFSRNSSLSSLSDEDQDEEQLEDESPNQDPSHTSVFAVEDTPLCFSRNSSLSSLSVESLDGETSASEQALLDECISSAMPRGQGKKSNRKQRSRVGKKTETETGDSGSDIAVNEEVEESQLSPLSPSEDASSEFSEVTEQMPEEVKPRRGPRITKPGEGAGNSQQETEDKGVRGRKKTYKSPISNASRSVTVPKSVQPCKTQPKVGVQKGPKVNATKTTTASVRSTTPNRLTPKGTNTPTRSTTPVRAATPTRCEANSQGVTTTKPLPINTDTFTKKKNLVTSRSITPPRKPIQLTATATATKSLANKQASSKPQAGSKVTQPCRDPSRSVPTAKSNLSSKSSPSSSRNTSPSSPASRSPRGSVSSVTSRTGPAAKSTSLSPARSPLSSRTTSPSPHTTASTRKPLTGLTKTAAGRGSGTTSPAPKTGLSNRSLSPRNSVTGVPQKNSSPRSSLSGPGSRSVSPRNSVSGSGAKTTSPRSSISDTSTRSLSPRNSISGIPARSVSPRNRTPGKAPVRKASSSPGPAEKKTNGNPGQGDKKVNSSPGPGNTKSNGSAAPGDKKVGGSLISGEKKATLVKANADSNEFFLSIDSPRPLLVKQWTFTKESASLPEHTPENNVESASLPEHTPENNVGSDCEADKAFPEIAEKEEIIEENEDVFSPDEPAEEECVKDEDKDAEEMTSPSSAGGGWRRISVDSEQSVSDKGQKPAGTTKTKPSCSVSNIPPTSRKTPLSAVKPAVKTVVTERTSIRTNPTKTAPKSPASVQRSRKETQPAPSWNSSVTAPKNWGGSKGRSSSPSTGNARSQSPLTSKSRSQSPKVARANSREEQGRNSPKSLEKPRDLCKEFDIPVKNYGGNVTSPVSASSQDGVWVKRDESTRASTRSISSISRQNSSTHSLQSQTSHTGSARSVKSSNSVTTSTSSSASKHLQNQKQSSQVEKQNAAIKQGKETADKKADKKKFSFLKLKIKGKKMEADDSKQKSKSDKKRKAQGKGKGGDPNQILSPESDLTSPETDHEGITLDQRLDHLGPWNSDDNIDNEVMPDEFVEWDSETDIFKEELPDEYLFESGSEVPSDLTSPDSPCKGAYQIENGNRTDDSPSPEFKQFRLENRLNSFIRMDSAENEGDSESTHSAPVMGETKNGRSKSVSDASPMYTSGSQSPPRPQRLRLPKKPFGINRSDSSPTTAIPVLVSPFNYSPSKRSQSEPQSPDMAQRRFQTHHSYSFQESRDYAQRYGRYKQRQDGPQEEIGCSSEDSDLISPTLSSRVTTV